MLRLIKELGAEAVFDPETLRILAAAFDDAWASVEASGAPLSEAKYAERAREIIGNYIIKAAKDGERDQRRLCDEALLQLTRSGLIKTAKIGENRPALRG